MRERYAGSETPRYTGNDERHWDDSVLRNDSLWFRAHRGMATRTTLVETIAIPRCARNDNSFLGKWASHMQFVNVSNDSEVRILELSRGRANAFNLAMVEELIESVRQGEDDDTVRALVFSSATPGFFSAGFDVLEVFAYDRDAMYHFFGRFMELFQRVLRMPKPVVGALTGHAYAGGAFLALALDVRIMAEGDFGFALNEINFGAVLPPQLRRALINAVGQREATRMILTGDSVKPQRALATGLADEVVPIEQVLPTALRHAHALAQKPSGAFAFSKRALQQDAGNPDSEANESLDDFVAQWFSPECAERRRALTASLKIKSQAIR
jgi:3,2-trans-enoyl-CoA isomerase